MTLEMLINKSYRFVLNNSGYTVERYFEGWDGEYNDVPLWEYGSLFTSLSPNVKTKAYKVDSAEDLDKLLSNNEFQTALVPSGKQLFLPTRYPVIRTSDTFPYFQCVDMIMDDKDAPKTMKALFFGTSRTRVTWSV